MSDSEREATLRLRQGPQEYLYLLADHLERPDVVPFEEIAASLQGERVLSAVGSNHPEAERLRRLREWVGSLRDGDRHAWGKLLGGVLDNPSFLKAGVGARLKALSPFANKALVSVEMRYGSSEFGGDISEMFSLVLLDEGHELAKGDRYVFALDPDALKGATVIQTRKAQR